MIGQTIGYYRAVFRHLQVLFPKVSCRRLAERPKRRRRGVTPPVSARQPAGATGRAGSNSWHL